MDNSIAFIFAIVIIVLAINLYMVLSRMRRSNRGRKYGRNRVAPDEAKQAIWRDKEIERRLEREQDGASERVKLREETLALYEKVRQRHAEKDRQEGLGFATGQKNADAPDEVFIYTQSDRLQYDDPDFEGAGYESLRLENAELDQYLSDTQPQSYDMEQRVEPIEFDPGSDELDPFDIFRRNKKK